MRDAFGGAFMIKLFIVFVFVYICLTALALNYAKAFKVKNAVIEYIENNEIYNLCGLTAVADEKINNFFDEEIVGTLGYSLSKHSGCEVGGATCIDGTVSYCHPSGVEITQSSKAPNTEGVYYTVSTYMDWSIPFLNKLLELDKDTTVKQTPTGTWKISGETRLIVYKEIEG